MRLLPQGVGLASVDSRTPQLGIALEPGFQRRGLGERLLLYERCGFVKLGLRNTYHLMAATLP